MKHHSPQAFPCPTGSDGGVFQVGMTLRDYFAAAALQTFRQPTTLMQPHEVQWQAVAAYQIADAMLQERDKS